MQDKLELMRSCYDIMKAMVSVMKNQQKLQHKHITSFQIIILGFLSVIILGSMLLMLPFATQDGKGAVFSDALFTSTSATV